MVFAITKYHRLDSVNDKFLIILEAGKSIMMMPADSLLVRALFLPFSCHFVVCSHDHFFVWGVEERALVSLFLIRALIPLWGLYPQDLI